MLRRAAGLRAVDFRAAPPDFLAAAGFEAPALRDVVPAFAVVALERFAAGLRRVAALRAGLRVAVERVAAALDDDVEPELADPSIENLPDMTRCAASATASAISEPSFVALCIIDLPAFSAVSAASMPASLIALRAFGLAAMAAAAAVRPAASISLLIAALASLSVVLAPEPLEREEEREDVEREEVFRVLDFAILQISFAVAAFTPGKNNSSVAGAKRQRKSATVDTLKGIAAKQRSPRTWSAAGSDGRPFSVYRRTPLSDLCAEP